MALSVSTLLCHDGYEHRTCGMHRHLLEHVRLAMNALPDSSAAEELCRKVLEQLPGDAAVLLAPPMGKAFAEPSRGAEEPGVVVWLLPDPTDVDSKQTTFATRKEGARPLDMR